jgi:hypothetical protein
MWYLLILLLSIVLYFSQIGCQSKLNAPLTIKLDTAIWYTEVANLDKKETEAMHYASVNVYIKGVTNARKLYFKHSGTGLATNGRVELDSLGRFDDTLCYSSSTGPNRETFQCLGVLSATNDTTQNERDMRFSPFLDDDQKSTIRLNFKSPFLKFNY